MTYPFSDVSIRGNSQPGNRRAGEHETMRSAVRLEIAKPLLDIRDVTPKTVMKEIWRKAQK
jgi:hypothetical protein